MQCPIFFRVRIHNYPSIKFDSFRHFFKAEDKINETSTVKDEMITGEDIQITEEDTVVNWQPKSR